MAHVNGRQRDGRSGISANGSVKTRRRAAAGNCLRRATACSAFVTDQM